MILFLIFTLFNNPMASAQICRDLFNSCAGCSSTEVKSPYPSFESSQQQPSSFDQLQHGLRALGWASSKATTALNEKIAAALNANPQKMNDPFFSEYMRLWSDWHSLMALHIESISRMPKSDQKRIRKKLEPLVHFSTEHYFVFLNTKNRSFNYNRMLGLLKTVAETTANTSATPDLTFFIYTFEKNIRKFSSEKEFKNCR